VVFAQTLNGLLYADVPLRNYSLTHIIRPMVHYKVKGEVNPNIKLDLNNSFCTLINKSNPQIF